MQKVLLFITFLLSNLIFSQNEEKKIDSLTLSFTLELEFDGINEFLIAKRYCIGAERLSDPNKPDKCDNIEPYYEVFVFWSNESENWIKKIDNCGTFKQVQMIDSTVIDFARKNKVQLSKEEVEKYTTEETKKKNEYLTVDHSCFRTFEFHTKLESFKKSFDLFDLSSETDNKNLYYESNNNLKLVEINRLCNEQILKIVSSEQFERER